MKGSVAGEPNDLISPADMADGDIGVIEDEGFDPPSIGAIAQRCGDDLILIGRPRGDSFCTTGITAPCICPLVPPFTLEITED